MNKNLELQKLKEEIEGYEAGHAKILEYVDDAKADHGQVLAFIEEFKDLRGVAEGAEPLARLEAVAADMLTIVGRLQAAAARLAAAVQRLHEILEAKEAALSGSQLCPEYVADCIASAMEEARRYHVSVFTRRCVP